MKWLHLLRMKSRRCPRADMKRRADERPKENAEQEPDDRLASEDELQEDGAKGKVPGMDRLSIILTEKRIRKEQLATEKSLQEEFEREFLEEEYPELLLDRILEPTLMFNGRPDSWIQSYAAYQMPTAYITELVFEAFENVTATSCIEILNNAPTVIYYNWRPLPHVPSFKEAHSLVKVQRFYFNMNSGVILPGDKQQILFSFKSPDPGIFSESWQMSTYPALPGGAGIEVKMRGVALHIDLTVAVWREIEQALQAKEDQRMVVQIVDRMLAGVCTPHRPSSPASTYLTQEDVFQQQNPRLHYVHTAVENLKVLWSQWIGPGEWDLNVTHFKQAILGTKVDKQEWLEEALPEINSCVMELSRPQYTVHMDLFYHICLELWREVIDNMVGHAMLLRQLLGITKKDIWVEELQENTLNEESEISADATQRAKAKSDKVDKKDKEDKKAKKPPPAKKGKGKEKKVAVKGSAAVPASKDGTPAAESPESRKCEEEQQQQQQQQQFQQMQAVLQEIYTNELKIQVKGLLMSMVEKMSNLFEEVRKYEPYKGQQLAPTLCF
ncbi:MYCBP-associated protein-like isoform X2 [Erpetoichthys calabaricus]|uniref:MYCBP-associated protein-like isoform X2 n=1 Tax=Erpetoichthys calabaricus TaxID=27687 RepID=UPI0022340C1F|nr:MYCBP-associated protein-like isoform X2 [Erpetoichthys calabaricus]